MARSILVIIWHLLADPTARFHDLGADFYTNRPDTDPKTHNHIRQLQTLGFTVTLTRPPDATNPQPRLLSAARGAAGHPPQVIISDQPQTVHGVLPRAALAAHVR